MKRRDLISPSTVRTPITIRAPRAEWFFPLACGAAPSHYATSFPLVNKTLILQQLHAALSTELAALTRAAQEAFAAATDPDSKAENKYDTRNLEASYIARGQAQRAEELKEAVEVFADFAATPRPARPIISLGALVTLQAGRELTRYVIASHGGGTEILHEGEEICVLTPASPLGAKLMGKRVGDRIQLRPDASVTVAGVH